MNNKNNATVTEFVNLRMENYKKQGLDLMSAYARMTGELQGIINFSARNNKELQGWINSSMADALNQKATLENNNLRN